MNNQTVPGSKPLSMNLLQDSTSACNAIKRSQERMKVLSGLLESGQKSAVPPKNTEVMQAQIQHAKAAADEPQYAFDDHMTSPKKIDL